MPVRGAGRLTSDVMPVWSVEEMPVEPAQKWYLRLP